jgi:hypothetical protein
MKILISESQFNLLKEQNSVNKNSQIKKSYTDPSKIKRVRLIFPDNVWWQKTLVYLAKFFGVITGVYKSLYDAINFVKKLANKNVKVDELVIGSHGRPGVLLMTQEGDDFYFNNSFLNEIKSIVQPTTKVFFTACQGADYLIVLKDAAEKLGTVTYGSQGIYNPALNKSENGFYYCKPDQYKKPKESYKNFIEFKDKTSGEFKINDLYNINLPYNQEMPYNISRNEQRMPSFAVKIEEGILKNKLPFMFPVSQGRNPPFSLPKIVKNAIEDKLGFYSEKYKEYGIDENLWQQNWDKFCIEHYQNDKIKVYVSTTKGYMNIKKMEPIISLSEINNEFLLKNGLCQKIQKSPINWI